MTLRPRSIRASAIVIMVVVVAARLSATGEDRQFIGRSLVDALRTLQTAGLRIVFTSATVTADLRVTKEPRSRDRRRQLDELLAPHGLVARDGPRGIIQIVRATRRRATPSEPTRRAATSDRGMDAVTRRENVIVSPPWPRRDQEGVVTQTLLDRTVLQRLHGSLGDDPVASVHTLPGVSAIDDYRSEFAVRGSSPRHGGVVIDGIPTGWLQHTAYGRGPAASIAMLPASIVEQVTLSTGTYPHLLDDRLGPQLELTIREGSRQRVALSGEIGSVSARVVGEGPLGRAGRGSWLVGARQSYSEWPSERLASSRSAFGFADVVGKAVYDVTPMQRVDVSVIGGIASIDEADYPASNGLGGGTSQAAVFNAGWRTLIGRSLVLSQRGYLARQRFVNLHEGAGERDWGVNTDAGYRFDLRGSLATSMIESGVQVTRRSTAVALPAIGGAAAASGWLRAAYVHVTWSPVRNVSLSPGLRVADSTLLRHPAIARWILARWTFRPGWTARASTGVAYQLPEPLHSLALPPVDTRRPERATHFDAGLEQRFTNTLRWQVTVFRRRERDVLGDPAVIGLAGSDVGEWLVADRTVNGRRGASRGVELMVERHGEAFAGWIAYAYGKTRHTDISTGESFWADYDQRHTLSLFGLYQVNRRTMLGATFRAGSNFPIPGSFQWRGDSLFAGSARNTVRLPGHARLDLRGDRQLRWLGRRFTLYAEVLNVLNRANVSLARGSIDPATGRATGFTATIGGRRGSGGVIVEF